MENVLITGDSFAADWSLKYIDYPSWWQLLQTNYTIKNVAQAGVSEYKILTQIQCEDLSKFNTIIIAHTSPYRVHTRTHPIHSNDILHSNCDLIYADIEYHSSKIRNIHNRRLSTAKNWFLWHYDEEYMNDIYTLIRNEIGVITKGINVISMCGFDTTYIDSKCINIKEYKNDYPGLINHLSEEGNKELHKEICQQL
jgi:hypothetical protein